MSSELRLPSLSPKAGPAASELFNVSSYGVSFVLGVFLCVYAKHFFCIRPYVFVFLLFIHV